MNDKINDNIYNIWNYLMIVLGGISLFTIVYYYLSGSIVSILISLVSFGIMLGLMLTVAKPQFESTNEQNKYLNYGLIVTTIVIATFIFGSISFVLLFSQDILGTVTLILKVLFLGVLIEFTLYYTFEVLYTKFGYLYPKGFQTDNSTNY